MITSHLTPQQIERNLNKLLVGMLHTPSASECMDVKGISLDSRQIKPGYLFLSLATDLSLRYQYLKMALQSGASVILFDPQLPLSVEEVSLITNYQVEHFAVRNLAVKAGEIAARYYQHPSLALKVIAVTGTNGKTSVTQFIAQVLEAKGTRCGVIGTLGVGSLGALQYTGMTTPDPVTLQRILAEMRDQSISFVVIEASSHALAQGRLNSVAIDCAVLTNLSRDHLDYHPDMADYGAAKASLFSVPGLKHAVINTGDDFGTELLESLEGKASIEVISYACIDTKNVADNHIQAKQVELKPSGLSFSVNSGFGDGEISVSMLGQFNVENLLATLAVLVSLDVSFTQAITLVSKCQSVAGRMELHGGKHNLPNVIVDYAHTPDALDKALQSLRLHLKKTGDLWCVFGCGGDRDAGKRRLMGQCAETLADKIILTDDNPRTEDSSEIINSILSGISDSEKVMVEKDRKQAITYAINSAKADDIVLVAGKGHENYQDINNVRHIFSDALVVCDVLKALSGNKYAHVESKA